MNRLLLGACTALLAAQAHATTTVGLRTGVERLTNDSQDWQESTLQVVHEFDKRHLLDLGLTRTERFGLDDSLLELGYTLPLSPTLTGRLDVGASSTHRVLARNAGGAALQFEFAPAWLLHTGFRSTRYNDVRVNQGLLMLERYVGAYSWAAGWRPARAFGVDAHGVELRGSYYYGERNSIGVILSGGKEAASIGGNVVLTSLRSAVLVGRHWLDPRFAVNYSLGHTRQGDFYSRNGVHLGVQYTF